MLQGVPAAEGLPLECGIVEQNETFADNAAGNERWGYVERHSKNSNMHLEEAIMNLRNLRYGEGLLWLGFAFCVLFSLDGEMENAPMLAGLFALAAIGVRATTPEARGEPDDKR